MAGGNREKNVKQNDLTLVIFHRPKICSASTATVTNIKFSAEGFIRKLWRCADTSAGIVRLFHKQFLAIFRRAKSALHRKTLSALRSFGVGDCIGRTRHHFSAVWRVMTDPKPYRKSPALVANPAATPSYPFALPLTPGGQLPTVP